MRRVLCLAALALPLCAQVNITQQGSEKISVEIDGKPFTDFYIGSSAPKPYLAPLRSAKGTVVTRLYPMESVPGEAKDHPHHRGLWFTHGIVNGYDFWANEESQKGEGKGKGVITLKKVEKITSGKKSGLIQATFEWTGGGEPILTEERKMVFYSDPNVRTIDFDILLRPYGKVTFGDTKEGTFAVRLAPELEAQQPRGIAEPKRNGIMVSSTGKTGEKQIWGKRAEWVDYYGTVKGEPVGIAIMDKPGNPRHPTYWHARAYGLFAANPFGLHDYENDKANPDKGDLTIGPGQPLRFRYRVVIHPGDYQSAGIAELFKQYAAEK